MSLQRLFGIERPIVQAPMAGSQGSALAIAVSSAGGLGSLPCALLDPGAIRAELSAIRSQTDRPFSVNLFCHTVAEHSAAREAGWRKTLLPYYQELGVEPPGVPPGPGRLPFDADLAELLAEFEPPVVSFHFGLPTADLVTRVRRWGAKIISSATTLDEARWLESRGVDAIVAQGLEAGGHRGMFLTGDLTTQVGTFSLVRQVARAVRVPVIAAGGIADRQGIAAALALGAAGVQIGTAFLLCPEASTSAVHRAALESDAARHTALTNLFSGRPARGIVNRLMREIGPIGGEVPEFPHATAAVMPLRIKAESQGSGDFSPLWSGQNATGCRRIPAGDLTRELAMA
jgi:nitronate monooxygenase